jgi:RNA polymerase sigma-70 factor, ECF subfamily
VSTRSETDPTDAELVERAKQGDRDAFAAIYRRHSVAVYRFCLSLCRSASAAEDVAHDVFVSLMADFRRYDGARAPLVAYLYGIARNHIRQRARREWRQVAISDGAAGLAAPGDLVADLGSAERREALRAALAVLPLRYREVVVLCDLHECDYGAAARVLRVPVGTVRSRLHRGRRLLAERLLRAEAPAAWSLRTLWRKLS